jgi:DNA-binding transcriptional LysR family regulator
MKFCNLQSCLTIENRYMGFVNLELDLLRTFVAAVEASSFARAADLVGRTPSAVSLQMDRLEDLCGQPLFRREGRRFLLTSTGEKLLVYARRLLAVNDETVDDLRLGQHKEVIRLGMGEDIASGCLPDVLKRFSLHRPEAYVSVRVGTSARLVNAVESGELDLAIAYGNQDRPGAIHACDQPMCWIGGSHERLRRNDSPVRLVLFAAPCAFRTSALEALDRASLKWEVVFESPNLLGQWAAVKAGLGISIRLFASVPPDLAVLGPEDGLPLLGTIPVTVHLARRSSPGVHDFRELLIPALSALAEPCFASPKSGDRERSK